MYSRDNDVIWNLFLEGAAEDMISSSLKKLNATPEEINFFQSKENGKLIFKPEHVSILYKWIKEENGNQKELIDDYKNYQKYFSNVKLDQFKSYLDWTQQVHGKRDEAAYQSRHKDIKDIELEGQDKENILANDDDVLILKGDDEHKCVRYGKGYSFCISRTRGGNMYGNYRLSKASTFYFIFFKKIPKEDEKHIMVLDRTENGWEWTFGNNLTKVIEGGWDEIIKTFPVLKKYKHIFVNKPLTAEEKVYQQKLRKFVNSPKLELFNQFSYKEKADVLKIGNLISVDVFESLDKYLRNEWITVGPRMSKDILEKLSASEKDRFIKVKTQQLHQTEPENEVEVEVCRNNPELNQKYIVPDKELCEKEEKEIQSQIINGIAKVSAIKINCKYHFPNLDNLKSCKDIYAPKAITLINLPQLEECEHIVTESATSINLPQLKESGNINADDATTINLPQLQKSGYINASNATTINLPQLRESGDIYAAKVTTLDLPQLRESGYIYASTATTLNLPQLQKSGDISAPDATTLNLPQLRESGNINARSITTLNLPQLEDSEYIYADNATTINLPQIDVSGDIYVKSAKKIIIRSFLRSRLVKMPKDCEIIEPKETQLNDSVIPSFKQFFSKILR